MNPHNKHANYKNAFTYVHYVFQWNMDNNIMTLLAQKYIYGHRYLPLFIMCCRGSGCLIIYGLPLKYSLDGAQNDAGLRLKLLRKCCDWRCRAVPRGAIRLGGRPGRKFQYFFGIKWLKHRHSETSILMQK